MTATMTQAYEAAKMRVGSLACQYLDVRELARGARCAWIAAGRPRNSNSAGMRAMWALEAWDLRRKLRAAQRTARWFRP